MERSQADNILQEEGNFGNIKNYRLISLLSHIYKLFTRIFQRRVEKILDKNQPTENWF